jgi:hypothetical protein
MQLASDPPPASGTNSPVVVGHHQAPTSARDKADASVRRLDEAHAAYTPHPSAAAFFPVAPNELSFLADVASPPAATTSQPPPTIPVATRPAATHPAATRPAATRLATRPAAVLPQKGRPSLSKNYSADEVMNLLDTLKQVLPIGGDEWKLALEFHSYEFPGRDVESIRRKFSMLHRKKMGTGNPKCPTDVKQAKRIKQLIVNRADMGDGLERFRLSDGSFGDDTIEIEDEGAEGKFDALPLPTDGLSRQPSMHASRLALGSTAPRPLVSPSPGKRGKNNNSISNSDSIHQLLEMSALQQQQNLAEERERRLEEREARREMNQLLTTALSGALSAFATAFGGNEKRKKKRKNNDSSSDDDNDANDDE